MNPSLSASVSCIDPLDYRSVFARLDGTGIDAYHFDLCDGHFAPTFLLWPGLLRALRPLTARRFDAHLYCTHPSRYLAELRDAGADIVIVHIEAAEDPSAVVPWILSAGMRAGVAILPTSTAPASLAPLLPALSIVVTNMVGPAYAGQPFDARGLENARAVAQMARDQAIPLEIAADGNVSTARLPSLLGNGCNHLVLGTSSIFRPGQEVGEALTRFRADAAAVEGAEPPAYED
jgi:ribulose-phosphate 3-epimerase